MSIDIVRGKRNPWTGLDRPWGFQKAEAPRFQVIRHVNAVRLSAPRTGHLYPQEIFLVFIYIAEWVDTREIARPEGCRWKVPVTPSPAVTFWQSFLTYRLSWSCVKLLNYFVPIVEIITQGVKLIYKSELLWEHFLTGYPYFLSSGWSIIRLWMECMKIKIFCILFLW